MLEYKQAYICLHLVVDVENDRMPKTG